MAKNGGLGKAKATKNDEFFTSYNEVEREMSSYLEFDKNVFKGKSILCPCDNPTKSAFSQYFTEHFKEYGIKELVSTCIAPNGHKRGKIQVISNDANGQIVASNRYLIGNGDFQSKEVTKYRDKADMVITNPPWSLFHEFFAWLIESGKQFITLCNINSIGYPKIFPYIKEGVVFPGNRWHRNIKGMKIQFEVDPLFEVSTDYYYDDQGRKFVAVASAGWLTNVPHTFESALELHTMSYNLQHSNRAIVREKGYVKYENYDAIEVPFCDAIPSDYDGVMGVPITFLEHYNPAKYEIVGKTGRDDPYHLKTRSYTKADGPILKEMNSVAVLFEDGKYRAVFTRILIKHRW